MDHHVAENAAGDLYIGQRGRLRVPGADFYEIDPADLPPADHVVNGPVVVVKAPAKTDLKLYTRVPGGTDGRADALDIIVDGLFTEDVLPLGGGTLDEIRMGVGGGADEHRLDLRIV